MVVAAVRPSSRPPPKTVSTRKKLASDPTAIASPARNREGGERAQQAPPVQRPVAGASASTNEGIPIVRNAAIVRWRGRKGKAKPGPRPAGSAPPRRRSWSGRGGRGGGCCGRCAAPRRPRAGSRENSSSSSTMSATPLVIWLPEPIATAIRARFSAGTSLTPSPIIAVKRPRSASAETSAFFCSGLMRQKIVLRLGDLPERAPVARQLVARDHPGLGRHSDRGGDRGHRLGSVARDQLQIHLLVAHELDRLAASGRSVSSITISASGAIGGIGSAVGLEGSLPEARPKATTRPSRARVRLEALQQGHRQRQRPAGQHTSGAPSTRSRRPPFPG